MRFSDVSTSGDLVSTDAEEIKGGEEHVLGSGPPGACSKYTDLTFLGRGEVD